MVKNFALMGPSGAGKTTIARMIESKIGHKPCKSGDVCRKICQIIYGNETRKNLNVITDALKSITPEILIAAALREAGETPVTIDSLRYQTDYDFARDNDFIIVRVHASREKCISRLRKRGQVFDEHKDLSHSSETELQAYSGDHNLSNEGTLDDLENAVDMLIAEIRKH